jgi:hypothetical protein
MDSFKADDYLSMPDFTGAEHIGDIGKNKIIHKKYKDADLYAISVDDKPVSFIQTIDKNILGVDYKEIQNVFTEKDFRGQNFCKNIIFFLRNVEKKMLMLGNVQSRLGQELNKSLAKTGRFPMFWLNTLTGEKHPYDYKNDFYDSKPYRSVGEPTGWQLIIEVSKIDFLPRFIPKTIDEGKDWYFQYKKWFD